jgi:hypothetical protein
MARAIARRGSPGNGGAGRVRRCPGEFQAPDSGTIMTFEIADTNLEPYLMADLEEMGQVGSHPRLNIELWVVDFGRNSDYVDALLTVR